MPRAHWVLFLLSLLSLLTALAINGYARPGGAGTSREGYRAALGDHGPAVAGPLIHFDGTRMIASRVPGSMLALTFEDGPDPVWTPRVLDTLRKLRVKATFFVVGSRVNQHPELVRRIVDEGHQLGLHSFNHTDMAGMSSWQRRAQLELSHAAVARATGLDVRLFRPPYTATPARIDPATLSVIQDVGAMGYTVALSDLDSLDATRPGRDAIAAASAPIDTTGVVILMHDGGGDRAQTIASLRRLVPETRKQGYRTVTIAEAMGTNMPLAAPSKDKIRGDAMWLTQHVSAVLADVLFVMLVAAVALAFLRMAIQVVSARLHSRRRRRLPPDDTFRPPLTVIVPARNEAANVAATVESLVANNYPGLEIIVVDDGSTDDTASIVEALDLPGVVVFRQPNQGKAAAMTLGIALARHDLLVLIDGDTIVEQDTLSLIVQPFRDPEVGGVAGNAKVANRTGILGRWQHLEYVIAFNLDRRVFEMFDCMTTIPGALGAFRREALTAVGGVSDDTLAEDTDLTMAICRTGWRVVYADAACAWTEAPGTWRGLWRQRYRWCYGTMQSMWKHRKALVEKGGSGRLGRRGLSYLALFQISQPLLAPIVDVYLIYALLFEPMTWTIVIWCGVHIAQLLVATYAFRLDKEHVGPLWALLLQQIVYRQLIYLVVIQSAVTALIGTRLRWYQPVRTGQAAALTQGTSLRDQVSAQRRRRDRLRGPLWARLCVWFGALLMVVSTGTVVVVQLFIARYEGAVNQADLLGPTASWARGAYKTDGPLNILLMGIDWRRGQAGMIRADTIMIMHVPRERNRAYLVSLPRDSLVNIPADPDSGFVGGRDRINAAFAFGAGQDQDRPRGGRLVAQVAANLTGLPGFDSAALLDFYGFMEVIKAVNGVKVCVDVDTKSSASGVLYRKGCSRMDGPSALDYMRQRKNIAGGDYARQRHQQQFIKAIMKEVTASNMLGDPAQLDRILLAVGGSLTVTTGPLTPTDLLLELQGISPDKLVLVRTVGKRVVDEYGRYVGEELQPLARELFAALREERIDEFVAAHPQLRNG